MKSQKDPRSIKMAKLALSETPEPKDGMASVDLADCDLLCKWFSVDRRTIYRWKHMGKLPCAIKIGHRNLWRVSDIREMVDEEFKAQAGA